MNRKILFMTGLFLPGVLWAQPALADIYSTSSASIVATGGRFFFALVCGMLLAFAFQWILTSLFLATGVTALGGFTRHSAQGRRGAQGRRREDSEADESATATIKKVGTGAAMWGLVATCISLFFAAWLAVHLLGPLTRRDAVTTGLAIWAGFFLAMLWLETAALGTLVGSLWETLKGAANLAKTAPAQGLASKVGEKASESLDDISEAVRREVLGGGEGVKEKLQSFVQGMPYRSLERSEMESGTASLFQDGEIRDMARQGLLRPMDRRQFHEVVSSRHDFNPEETRILTELLHSHWNRMIEESRREAVTAPATASALAAAGAPAGPLPASLPAASATASALETGYAPTGTAAAQPAFSARFQGFRDFLRNSDKRELNPARLEQEVETLVMHPEEGPAYLERGMRELNRDEMVQVLRQRRDITLQEADSIADLIDSARARLRSRSEVREHRAQEYTNRAMAKLRDYVYSLKRPEPDYTGLKQELMKLFDDPKAGYQGLKSKLAGLDRDSIVATLSRRRDLSQEEAEKFAAQVDEARNAVLASSEKIEQETRRRVEQAKRVSLEKTDAALSAAAHAAWWLFSVAVVSGCVSALGGWIGRVH